jgi:hypothetical protein
MCLQSTARKTHGGNTRRWYMMSVGDDDGLELRERKYVGGTAMTVSSECSLIMYKS